MENTLPQAISPSELGPVKGTGATPFSQQTVVLTKQAYIELTWKANDWQAPYERLVEREAALKADVEALQATIRDLTQRLYGAKSEHAASRQCWRLPGDQSPQAGPTAWQPGA